MAEYVKLSCVVKEIEKFSGYLDEDMITRIQIVLRRLPDKIDIVYCKDCHYCMEDSIFGGFWCKGRKISGDGFCADGKNKENV